MADSTQNTLIDVIIKYAGDIDSIRQAFPNATFKVLLGNYAIVHTSPDSIDTLIRYPDIINISVPEPVFFDSAELNQPSDNVYFIPPLMPIDGICPPETLVRMPERPDFSGELPLTGRGVLLGIVDSGISTDHPAFKRSDGTSRIIAYMDMNEASEAADISGHGTAVAGIAGGYQNSENEFYQGIAYEADFVIARLKTYGTSDFSLTSSLMEGIDFVARTAIELRRPCVINISYGTQAGAHNGQSILETYLDEISDIWEFSIVCGTGNDGNKSLHVLGELEQSASITHREILRVGERQTNFTFSMWKDSADEIFLRVTSPDGQTFEDIPDTNTSPVRFESGNTTLNLLIEPPRPYENIQEFFFSFTSSTGILTAGEWTFELIPRSIKAGTFSLWLSGGESISTETQFINPDTDITLTIPSTALKVISVGAYDYYTLEYAAFSGQGFTWQNRYIKPDLAAPGVNILAPSAVGGYRPVTGTSFAAPMVSGVAALLMEWGLVRGNDPLLYAEKLRAYLQRGAAIPKAGFPYEKYPNQRLGYGLLCFLNSIPVYTTSEPD